MDASVTLSVGEIIKLIITISGAITAVAAAVGVIIAIVKKAKLPNQRQDERIDELETVLGRHTEMLDNDNKRLKSIEDGNRITQRALLALLAHGIDGNDIDMMKKVKVDLQEYLIEK